MFSPLLLTNMSYSKVSLMKFFCQVFLSSFLYSTVIYAGNEIAGESYIQPIQPFVLMKDINRQADAWAICSATWTIMSMLSSKKSDHVVQNYKNLSNGAKAAVAMTFIKPTLVSAEEFNENKYEATVTYATEAMNFLPEAALTSIMADYDLRGTDVWFKNVTKTLKVCTENLEEQQAYIDLWRTLATSGLMKLD